MSLAEASWFSQRMGKQMEAKNKNVTPWRGELNRSPNDQSRQAISAALAAAFAGAPKTDVLRMDFCPKDLYASGSDVTRVFWEWRHKVILLYFSVVAAVFIGFTWMVREPQFYNLRGSPFFAGMLFCLAIHRMDRCNAWILFASFKMLARLEKDVDPQGGVYQAILDGAATKPTYSKILGHLYPVSAGLFLILGAASYLVM